MVLGRDQWPRALACTLKLRARTAPASPAAQVKGPKGDKASRDVTQEMEERSVSLVSSLLQVRAI